MALSEVQRRSKLESASNWTTTYSLKYVSFAKYELGIEYLTPQQIDVIRAVRDAILGTGPRFIVIPAGHGVGKSYLMALLCIAFGATNERALVMTTAPTWMQVQNVLWGEINFMAERAMLPGNWHLTGYKMSNGSEGIGISTNEGQRFQGYHRGKMLVILDEGPGVDAKIWETIQRGIAVSDNSIIVAPGNPLEPGGPFHEVYKKGLKNEGRWKSMQLSCLEHPNVIEKREIIPGAVSYSYVKEMIEEYCEPVEDPGEMAHLDRVKAELLKSPTPPRNPESYQVGDCIWWEGAYFRPGPIVQSRVLGVFPDEGEDTLFPLRWVQRAMDRGQDVLRRLEKYQSGEYGPEMVPEWDLGNTCVVAMDVARFGPDSSVIGARRGRVVLPLEEYRQSRTTASAGRLVSAVQRYGAEYAAVDNSTFGASVGEMAEDAGVEIYPIDFQGRPGNDNRKVLYLNKRAQMYWGFRCLLEHDMVDLPPDDILMGQLTTLRYTFTQRGQIQIESKRDVKKRGLPSPDRADTCVMLCDETLAGGYEEREEESVDTEDLAQAATVGLW